MRYRLRTLLMLMTVIAVIAAVGGPGVARAVKEWTNPKPHTPLIRKWLIDWERFWNGDDEWHGGVI